ILIDGPSTAAYLVPRLTQFFQGAGLPPAQAQAQAQAVAGQLVPNLAQIPVGVISSEDVNANGAQLLTTYINVDDNFDVYGLDLSATALLSDSWSLSGTLSLVNDNVFETEKGEQVTLNAPKTKAAVALQYRGIAIGLNAELRARFNDEFPVRSGVYNGTLCLGGSEVGAEPCVESFTLVDLVLGYRLPFQGASIQLSVQNLLDEDYRSFPGVPTIGRMALLRLQYDFCCRRSPAASRLRGLPRNTSGPRAPERAGRFCFLRVRPSARAGRHAKQFARVLQPRRAVRVATQHAGQLAHALLARQLGQARRRAPVSLELLDAQVVVGAGRDLRQVGDDENLVALGDAAQVRRDPVGRHSADAGIDLIEHQGRHLVQSRKDGLEREHHAGKLAARGDAGERPRLEADVERDAELDRFRARRADLGERVERDLEAAGQPELGQD